MMRAFALIIALLITAPAQATFILGIGGGSASGKTTEAFHLSLLLRQRGLSVLHITQDRYFVSTARMPLEDYINGRANGDAPSAMNFDLMVQNIIDLRAGRTVRLPLYDYIKDAATIEADTVAGFDVIIFEGIHALHDERLRNLMDLRIFLDVAPEVRLERRIYRDVRERGQTEPNVRRDFAEIVQPMHLEHIEPTKVHAHMIHVGEHEKYALADYLFRLILPCDLQLSPLPNTVF